jgi:hypothetical protein
MSRPAVTLGAPLPVGMPVKSPATSTDVITAMIGRLQHQIYELPISDSQRRSAHHYQLRRLMK